MLTWERASRHNRVRTFWTSQLPKVLRSWGALYVLTRKCALRHNGVQFFISHLTTWLRTRRFSEPTFRPSGATNHWKKHSESRLSYLFAHLHLLSSHSFWSYLFFSSSLLFSDSSHLCFSNCPYCRTFVLNFLRSWPSHLWYHDLIPSFDTTFQEVAGIYVFCETDPTRGIATVHPSASGWWSVQKWLSYFWTPWW